MKIETFIGSEKLEESEGKTISEALNNLENRFVKGAVRIVVTDGNRTAERRLLPPKYLKMKGDHTTRDIIAKILNLSFNE